MSFPEGIKVNWNSWQTPQQLWITWTNTEVSPVLPLSRGNGSTALWATVSCFSQKIPIKLLHIYKVVHTFKLCKCIREDNFHIDSLPILSLSFPSSSKLKPIWLCIFKSLSIVPAGEILGHWCSMPTFIANTDIANTELNEANLCPWYNC